ncbi:hypothetical protein EV363DRAFT_1196677 [Boletus edulis]|nr:hypothetical protein EV363DRAFT_1196677 [Boletus edulis]
MLDSSTSELEVSLLPSALEITSLTIPELQVSSPPTFKLKSSPPSKPSLDNPRIVITGACTTFSQSFGESDDHLVGIRAQNIPFGCKRIPIGIYVLVQFDGVRQRTQIKPIRLLNDSDIEWNDVIFLPSQVFDKVRITVYASFELNPMLGNGEVLYASETHLEELVGGTYCE